MIQFEYEGKEYNMPENWDEVTLQVAISFFKTIEKNQLIPTPEFLLMQELIEICCGVEYDAFSDMPLDYLVELMPYIQGLSDTADSYVKKNFVNGVTEWEIDGRIYSYRTNPNEMTAGELSDIKTLYENRKNEWDVLLDMAAILIRPAVKTTTEAGNVYYKLSKSTAVDYQFNKEVINGFLLKDVLRVINFFSNGTLSYTNNMKNSLLIKRVMK